MTTLCKSFSTNRVEGLLRRVQTTQVVRNHGRVIQLIGLVIESEGPLCAVGEICRSESARHDGSTLAEVVGFRNHHVLLMPLGELHGIHPGSEVIALGATLQIPVGESLKGRVIDGLGHPLDNRGPIEEGASINLNQPSAASPETAAHRDMLFALASSRLTPSLLVVAGSGSEFFPAAASANQPCWA